MAEFIRGGTGVVIHKEKLHGSPSTGSEEGHEGVLGEDFDPFLNENDEADGANTLAAPPETQNTGYRDRCVDRLVRLVKSVPICSDGTVKL